MKNPRAMHNTMYILHIHCGGRQERCIAHGVICVCLPPPPLHAHAIGIPCTITHWALDIITEAQILAQVTICNSQVISRLWKVEVGSSK
jgi:hypothetical protein